VVSNAGAAKFLDRFLALQALKLQEMAEKERRAKLPADSPLRDGEGMDGEGKPGAIDPAEPKPVQALQARMQMGLACECCIIRFRPRMRRQVGITRLILHLDVENLEKYGEEQLGEFLT
jgi:hypothetical protein